LGSGIPIYVSVKTTFSTRPSGTISLIVNNPYTCSGGKCTLLTDVGHTNYVVVPMPTLVKISGCVEIDDVKYCNTVVELSAGLHKIKTIALVMIDMGLKIELTLS